MRTSSSRRSQKQHNHAAASTAASSTTAGSRGNHFRKPAEAAHEDPSPTATTAAPTATATENKHADTSAAGTTNNRPAADKTSHPKSNRLGDLLGGEILRSKWLRKQRGIIIILVLFCLVLVTNRYYVEALIREQHATKENIKFLREERIRMKKEYQENVRISNIVNKLDSIGVGLIAGPPYEITVDKQKRHRKE